MTIRKHGTTQITSTYTLAAASANGYANDVAYATGGYALTATTAGDGCAHPLVFKGNAATDHSAKTLTLVGTDANGVAQTETLAAPNGTATVTSAYRYKTITSVAISATTGADTFDIGWTALASTPWVTLDTLQPHFAVGVGVALVSGSANYDLERTYDEVDTNATVQVAYNDATMAGKTASSEVGLTTPVKAIRLDVNSHTSGVLRFTVLQGGRS
jgi:hypothetical protein